MFPPTNTPLRPAPRLVSALRLIRSFLLLEDDYGDWEVGQDEHPHRMVARAQRRDRRPGAIETREQVCACPLAPLAGRSARTEGRRALRPTAGSERRSPVGGSRGISERP